MKKALFGLLPYWTPLMPPLSLACLKSYIKESGWEVITFDANIDNNIKNFYSDYFTLMKKWIPKKKLGNLFNIGNDLLEHHLMLRYNSNGESDELVKLLIKNNFFYDIKDKLINGLNVILSKLEEYLLRYVDRLITEHNPEILGLSVYRGTLSTSMHIFRHIKKTYPHIKTILGGPIFSQELVLGSPNFEQFIKKATYIDHIFIGEGEIMLLNFLKGKIPNHKKVITIEDVDNQLIDINETPLPNFNADTLKYYMYIPTYSSRGCPFKCSFCAETIHWLNYRKKQIKSIISDMDVLSETYGKKLFLFADSLINPILEGLSEELNNNDNQYYFDGYLRIDKHTSDNKKVMNWRKAGFYRARLGIESGSQKILDSMDKKIDIAKIKENLMNLAKAGIKTTTYWIVGYPGESEEDFNMTLTLLSEMKDYIYEAECNPFRFFYAGQSSSDDWGAQFKKKTLYPKEMKDALLYQTWILYTEPFREETHNRICRFEEHRLKLGIPNPYSLEDIFQADERWKLLHENAVPNICEFQ